MRQFIDLSRNPVSFRFMDSMNAALVASLTSAGGAPEDLVGNGAAPWTFGVKGYTKPGGEMVATGVLLSTPSATLASAFEKLDPRSAVVCSANGDRIDLGKGFKTRCRAAPGVDQDEAMLCFQSPVAIMQKKDTREKTAWVESLTEIDIDAALKTGLERRAGRSLDIAFAMDRLTRMTAIRRKVPIRRDRQGRSSFVIAFSAPIAVRGTPADLRFAYLAGLGAKTRAGFGCPLLAS